MSDKYLAYFDCLGFECVYNITALESEFVMSTLQNQQYDLPFNLDAMKMRARFNSQRHPEIWFFNVSEDISEQDVRDLADSNPQYLVDFIRANGKNVYGKKSRSAAPVIV